MVKFGGTRRKGCIVTGVARFPASPFRTAKLTNCSAMDLLTSGLPTNRIRVTPNDKACRSTDAHREHGNRTAIYTFDGESHTLGSGARARDIQQWQVVIRRGNG